MHISRLSLDYFGFDLVFFKRNIPTISIPPRDEGGERMVGRWIGVAKMVVRVVICVVL